jgi:hypothetical protein
MTDATTPRSPWIRPLFRAAGLAAVVLGGWCLWLGFQPNSKPSDVEAFHDWKDADDFQDADQLAEPRRLSARITDVADSFEFEPDGRVVTADRSDHSDQETISVVSYSPGLPAGAPRDLARLADAENAAGAWLTGDIEDPADMTQVSRHARRKPTIPAWKRTSTPLRQGTDRQR